MKNKYYGKPVVAAYNVAYEHGPIECVVLDDGDYWNVHVIHPKYREDEMNTLVLQEPKDSVKREYFTTQNLMEYIGEFVLWDLFYPFSNDFYITVKVEDQS